MVLPALFAVTLFVSAALLFSLQPMVAKMVLPLLGGAPAVWNTCMVFFQALLLAGYLYAHVATRLLGVRRQAALHLVIVLAILLGLPIGLPEGWQPPGSSNPSIWLIGLLLAAVGAPFVAVAASAPMLQRWFAETDHPSAANPYFLYAISNVGSIAALLAYPSIIEPQIGLSHQTLAWNGGFALLATMTLGCALFLRPTRPAGLRQPRPDRAAARTDRTADAGSDRAARVRQRARWLLLSFVPSSLLLGVTNYLTADIAAFPLMWIIPLVIYLSTFALAFAGRPWPRHVDMVRVQPFLILPLIVWLFWGLEAAAWQLFLLHLVAFFALALVCHGVLAESRPPAARLTEFYVWISIGGVLGGAFNALVAPVLFDTVLEYPLAITLACLLRPGGSAGAATPARRRFLTVPPWLRAGLLAALVLYVTFGQSDLPAVAVTLGMVLLAVLCYGLADRPLWFGAAVGGVLLSSALAAGGGADVLLRERSYFGVHRVEQSGQFHMLRHGTTIHGIQDTSPGRRHRLLSYYFGTGPLGQLFDALPAAAPPRRVAVVGLGTGNLACYGMPGESWTFYEIDPVVERIARDPGLFTFLADCGPDIDVVIGDGRVSLAKASDGLYDLIVFDAFSSDAIPVHLITREAVALYLDKLAQGGVLVFHISNRYLDLQPALGGVAAALGLVAHVGEDYELTESEIAAMKFESDWVAMARSAEDLGRLTKDPRWRRLHKPPGAAVWSDDFSNVFDAIRWLD